MTTHRDVPGAATYVFCLVQSVRPPSLRGVPGSVPGAGAPRLISVDRDIWAVVADAPLERFDSERLRDELQDIESISRHAVAHASVVEYFFRRAPVIPLKIFTLFSADARVQQHLQSRRTRLRKLFAQLRGLEEWGVRIITRNVEADSTKAVTRGRDYLRAKKRLADQRTPSRRSVNEVNAALKALGRRASKIRKDVFPAPGHGRPFVAGGSFLVKATHRPAWKKEVLRLAGMLAKRGHRLEVSGPWPPYHFVSA
jgi:Gas vesicle synthesis protein GvpL/GvpF